MSSRQRRPLPPLTGPSPTLAARALAASAPVPRWSLPNFRAGDCGFVGCCPRIKSPRRLRPQTKGNALRAQCLHHRLARVGGYIRRPTGGAKPSSHDTNPGGSPASRLTIHVKSTKMETAVDSLPRAEIGGLEQRSTEHACPIDRDCSLRP